MNCTELRIATLLVMVAVLSGPLRGDEPASESGNPDSLASRTPTELLTQARSATNDRKALNLYRQVLDLDPAIGRSRQGLAGKGADRMEREDAAFHDRVAGHYLAAAGPGVHHLNGGASPEAVLRGARDALVHERPDLFAPASEPA